MVSFLESPHPEKHSLFDDFQGLMVGTLLVALSVTFLQNSGLFTGQIAGLALVASKALGVPFAALFFVFNMPFYVIAYLRMGLTFTLKTFMAVGLLSLWSYLLPSFFTISDLNSLVAAILAGITAGSGLIALFRHGATLGGVGIVAVWLQDTRGIKAGWTQLGFDVVVFALALSFFDLNAVVFSLIGAAITNIMIATNHRRDRYIAR
ncbi:YitT family protein [Shimia sp. R9_1]|uniref:YitT family protein n=1 Tax=unclassified Shimia TaxID=2630038 RepID=UPI001ADCB1A0|nr:MULTISPECIES: YitT family protein [unclassified Shimia]MBO9397139.1 YitT family protein [Shimia sp. R9_2]MBO9408372.1 YitT family protein [Shimia sp. R9_1]